MRHLTILFLRDDGGGTLIEYAFLASLIALVIVGSLTALGTSLTVPFVLLVSAFTG